MFERWLTNKDETALNSKDKTTLNNVTTSIKGAKIEYQAYRWLIQQGLRYIESNYRCQLGEIDIVMLDKQQLVFVEVRYRKQMRFGRAEETVDWRKQQKLIKTAAHYLMHRPKHNQRACRFDVLAVTSDSYFTNKAMNHRRGVLRWYWIQDAFTA